MPNQDQLEIIRANGAIEFYTLDPGRGITNIGRHPENNIVIDSPGVALFHAVIDHRQKPYHLVVLSHDGDTTLAGQTLPPNVSIELYNWDNIQLDGHTLVLVESGSAYAPALAIGSGLVSTPSGGPPAVWQPGLPPPITRPEQAAAVTSWEQPQFFSTTPSDMSSEAIVVELPERQQTVQVEQTARYALTIINGGSVVATFTVGVMGLDPDWVTVSPPQVNLYEGQRETLTVTVTPPRQSTSQAGSHSFAIVVSSPNYPGQRSQRGAELIIEPFYDFMVGELMPKRQSIGWFKRSGQCSITIINKGNSQAPFRVDGQDDERTCSFEFEVPGEAVGLARQIDLRVLPEESISLPMFVTPHSRRLVGLRARAHNFTITTTLLEGQQTPRSQLGQLKSAPLFGPLHILLMIILLFSLIWLFFDPSIRLNANPKAMPAGQQVMVGWSTWPPFFVSVKLNDGATVQDVDPQSNRTDRPIKTTIYEITADTWLSRLFTPLMGQDKVTVQVTPIRPNIGLFQADPNEILSGQTTILSWFVVGADELKLINNASGVEEELSESSGSRPVRLEESTNFTLKAANASVPDQPVEELLEVVVSTPVPTPAAKPNIELFLVQPQVITAGQEVTLQWVVTGVDSVSVTPLGDKLPAISPPITHKPQETTLYVLTASNGQETINSVQQVVVQTAPTPTPTPPPGAAPVIEFFGITPEEQTRVEDVRDDDDNEIEAQLNWVVSGDTTNVEITGGPPGFERLSNLARVGKATLNVKDTTVFILTAYNGDINVVKTTEIKFLDPTPTPEGSGGSGSGGGGSGSGTPTPVPPQIVFFTAAGISPPKDQVTALGGNPPTYQVVAGSNVNLSWGVQNSTQVTLVGVGDQPPAGNLALFNVSVGQTYQLKVVGPGGNTQAFLQLVITSKPAPPAPFNVNGTPLGLNINLTWDYSAENDIIGFRVYRATAVGGPFVRVADESQLSNGARQWIDVGPLPVCTGYYVTAVYVDPVSGNTLETAASANSWFSPGC